MAVRRKLKGHKNFDLTCGIDLTDKAEEEALFKHLSSQRVFCVVLGPPCTAFGPWVHVNKSQYGLTKNMRRTLNTGTILANLAARVCEFQLSKGRHFIVENPKTSQMWSLPAWQRIISKPGVAVVDCDQCMFGLRTRTGELA